MTTTGTLYASKVEGKRVPAVIPFSYKTCRSGFLTVSKDMRLMSTLGTGLNVAIIVNAVTKE